MLFYLPFFLYSAFGHLETCFATVLTRFTSLAARDAVTSWYDEIKDYNYNKATFGMNTGR